MSNEHDLEIMGQKIRWPSTVPAAIAFVSFAAVVLILVLGIPYVVGRLKQPDALRVLEETGIAKVTAGTVDGNSGRTIDKIDKILVFSIPSQFTKYDVFFALKKTQIQKSDFEQFKRDYPYYFVSDLQFNDLYSGGPFLEPEVERFVLELEKLRDQGLVQGYDLYQSMGRGSRGLKRGYTIRLTIPEGSSYNKSALAALYKIVWNRPDVYIEEYQVAKTLDRKN
jgi:hypothetical protein